MQRFVPLDRVPDDLRIPADLTGRIHYDAGSHRLAHEGFMSKAEFDRLVLLSDDWPYRRALEELFRLCGDEGAARRPGYGRRLASILHGLGLL